MGKEGNSRTEPRLALMVEEVDVSKSVSIRGKMAVRTPSPTHPSPRPSVT